MTLYISRTIHRRAKSGSGGATEVACGSVSGPIYTTVQKFGVT